MRIKCEYCGSFIDDTFEKCPNCGATNEHLKRNANQVPETIEQLKTWYIEHNLPDENTTRFFIGKNYTGARAFGIYKDEGSQNFVVYKNKSDGSRAVRYEGKDEKYAVNELYQKLKEEIVNQKANQGVQNANIGNNNYRPKPSNKYSHAIIWIVVIIIFLIMVIAIATADGGRGYYKYNNNYYYRQSGSWYIYDYYGGSWEKPTYIPEELRDNYSDYYESSRYSSSYGIDDFKDSSYYVAPSHDSDWDSSSTWSSSDSWDSGGTDWDSDW